MTQVETRDFSLVGKHLNASFKQAARECKPLVVSSELAYLLNGVDIYLVAPYVKLKVLTGRNTEGTVALLFRIRTVVHLGYLFFSACVFC